MTLIVLILILLSISSFCFPWSILPLVYRSFPFLLLSFLPLPSLRTKEFCPISRDFGPGLTMSLVIPTNFQHILRVLNTNIDGKRNVMFALTAIKGLGRR